MTLGDACNAAHNLSRRAVAALKTIVRNERRLKRMKLAVFCQALHRGNRFALVHDRKRKAGVHTSPVNVHRAGTARAEGASLLAAGQMEMIA